MLFHRVVALVLSEARFPTKFSLAGTLVFHERPGMLDTGARAGSESLNLCDTDIPPSMAEG